MTDHYPAPSPAGANYEQAERAATRLTGNVSVRAMGSLSAVRAVGYLYAAGLSEGVNGSMIAAAALAVTAGITVLNQRGAMESSATTGGGPDRDGHLATDSPQARGWTRPFPSAGPRASASPAGAGMGRTPPGFEYHRSRRPRRRGGSSILDSH